MQTETVSDRSTKSRICLRSGWGWSRSLNFPGFKQSDNPGGYPVAPYMLSGKHGCDMTDAERIAGYRAERDKALETVRGIDEGRVRFFEAKGNEDIRDVTAQRRTDQQRVADMMETVALAWEKWSA